MILTSSLLGDDGLGPMTKTRAIERIRDALVDRACVGAEIEPHFFDEVAAAWVSSSGQATVADVTSTFEQRSAISRMSALGVDSQGRISFRVPAIAWSLASRRLVEDVSVLDSIAADPRMLHRWSSAVEVALDSGDQAIVRDILAATGNARACVRRLQNARRFQRRNGRIACQPDEVSGRVHSAMKSWVKGVGPLAPVVVPRVGDDALRSSPSACPARESTSPGEGCRRHRSRTSIGRPPGGHGSGR